MRFLEGDNDYKIQSTVVMLDEKPVLQIFPPQNLTFEMPDSQILTIGEAAEMFSKVFVGDLGNRSAAKY